MKVVRDAGFCFRARPEIRSNYHLIMQRFVIEGDRATYRFRPMDFAGGGCLFAGIATVVLGLVPMFRSMQSPDEPYRFSMPLNAIPNLLLALIGMAMYCVVSTVVIDKKSGVISQRHEIIWPLGLSVWRLFGNEYKLSDLNCVEIDRTVARRRSPTLSLSGPNNKGVQLLGTWFRSDELEKIGQATAEWLRFEMKDRS